MTSNRYTTPIAQQLQKAQKDSWLDSILNSLKRFNPCLRPELKSQRLTAFLKQFNEVSLYDDPYFGEVFLLQSLTHDKQILLKKEKVGQDQAQTRLNQIKQLQYFNSNPHILSQNLVQTIYKNQFLWPKLQLYLYYDAIVFDLQKQFEYRLAKGTKFSDRQILNLIKGACKGYVHLQGTNYASVRMSYIYFTRKGFVKIAHPQLFHYKSNLQTICQYEPSKGIYLSPQQMYCLQRGQKNALLGWKSNSFAFGMVILSLMTLSHLNQVYDYSGCVIDRPKIDVLLRNCRTTYSERLVNLVEKLLDQRPEQRMNLRTFLNKISQNVQSHNTDIDLELLNQNIKPFQHYNGLYDPTLFKKQPEYVNYISGIVHTKVASTGQFYNQDKLRKEMFGTTAFKSNENQVVAEQRHFYTNRNSLYVGDAMNRIGESFGQKPIRQGKGYYMNQDGQYFIGDWQKGEMTGYGKLYWSQNKIRYEGDFKNGKFHGSGIQFNGDPNFVGFAQPDDEPDETFVRMQRNNWIKYQGNFAQDKRQGQGIVYFKTGRWIGNFKNGQPNGQGFFIKNNGHQIMGTWRDGIRV